MVSDFIDEHNGFLALTDKEHQAAKVTNPTYARSIVKASGHGTSLLLKCVEQLRSPTKEGG